MKNSFRFGKAAALFCVFMIAAGMSGLTGCGKKYEEIQLTEMVETSSAGQDGLAAEEGSGAGAPGDESLANGNLEDTDSTSQAGVSATQGARSIVLEDADGIEAAEDAAVAGVSALESELTMANGFTDMNETVYITEDLVNVRSGCGTEYGILTQLNAGDSIACTGRSEGWYRVQYGDKTGYVKADFVSTADPKEAGSESTEALAAQAVGAGENSAPLSGQEGAQAPVSNGRIVAIDAGHQAKGNPEKEPVGPGSSTMKAKVASGAEGVVSGLPEYKLTLAVSQKLKRILEERGYQVVMIRESNDVNLSNAERARIANESGASIFVRIHGNSLDNSSVHGTLSMCQTSKNPYNGELHDASYSLSKKITDAVCAATGFKNRGVQETDTMSGINWCTIPVSIVEMGFMSNPEEDQKMAQDDYQERIAGGIANGIDDYFN